VEALPAMSQTLDERITRWERRQEVIIASLEGMVDTMTTIRDMIAELDAWLKEPPSNDLSDLLRVLIATNQTISSQVDEIGGKMDVLRATVVRSLRDSHVE
jgi:hypothetical protein